MYKFFYPIKNHTQATFDLVRQHVSYMALHTEQHDDHYMLFIVHDWSSFITTVCNVLAGWDLINFLTDLKPYND